MLKDGTISADGGDGKKSVWVVRRTNGERGFRLESGKFPGSFLALKDDGSVQKGTGGQHCWLKKEGGANANIRSRDKGNRRLGFNPNGQHVPSSNVGTGNRATFTVSVL
eukprot:CAMPEP_0174274872 /NCGR_PEP_ID=MMETSP0439-20130205/59512_1 /TAXON_ID=0 /ORGANISM="Stereomyxa ramosa, Strain Chinc5" /LENGTH=108 /DNA_ID=CAMNT_0015366915 /DNA_START=107 /DNA_END=436 /DNA_ORIENTATION=+